MLKYWTALTQTLFFCKTTELLGIFYRYIMMQSFLTLTVVIGAADAAAVFVVVSISGASIGCLRPIVVPNASLGLHCYSSL